MMAKHRATPALEKFAGTPATRYYLRTDSCMSDSRQTSSQVAMASKRSTLWCKNLKVKLPSHNFKLIIKDNLLSSWPYRHGE